MCSFFSYETIIKDNMFVSLLDLIFIFLRWLNFITQSLWTMSGEDTDAIATDYKWPLPNNIEEGLIEIEQQDKSFENDLEKYSHNKDIDTLKAERDELKSQMIKKIKNSEKDKLCREIEQIRQVLYSLDNDYSGAPGGEASSGLAMQNLRKMDILNSVVNSSAYLEDDDEDDDVTTRILKGKSERQKR